MHAPYFPHNNISYAISRVRHSNIDCQPFTSINSEPSSPSWLGMVFQFPIELIPEELLFRIIKKLPVSDFLKFQRTRKSIHTLCHSGLNLVTIQVRYCFVSEFSEVSGPNTILYIQIGKFRLFTPSEIPKVFRIKTERFDFCSELNSGTADFILREMKLIDMSCTDLRILKPIKWTRAQLTMLFKKLKPSKFLFFIAPLSRELIPVEAIKHFANISVDASDYNDDDLVALRGSNLTLESDKITCLGLNRLLKLELQNSIRSRHHTFKISQVSEAVLFEDLNANLLYSTATHDDSVLRHLRADLLNERIREWKFFVLIKPSSLETMYIVKIKGNCVEFEIERDPVFALTRFLFPSDYENVTRQCFICRQPDTLCTCDGIV